MKPRFSPRARAVAALALAPALAGAIYLATERTVEPARRGRPLAVLRKADAPTRVDWQARLTTLAGSGVGGAADGAAATSRFSDPFGVVVDAVGNVFVADGGDSNRIRRISPAGEVSTFAGAKEGFADGVGTAAAFNTPSGLAIDRKGNLIVADTANHAIRRIAPNGTVTTLAGNGKPGQADGVGIAAQFNGPVAVALDKAGNVFVADTYNDSIRRIAPDGTVSTVAGTGHPGANDGSARAASFDTPSGIAVGRDGTLYVADTGNDAVRVVAPGGQVTTLAAPPEGERRPLLKRPVGIALTHDGYVYVASSTGGRILQFGKIGTPGQSAFRALDDVDASGDDRALRLYAPRHLAVEPDGSLLVADALAWRVQRLVAPAAGSPPAATPAPVQPLRTAGHMPWPISPQFGAHEVVGLMGEVRGSYDGESRDHFHGGLDVRADVGETVLAVSMSKVTDPYASWGFGSLTEGMSVGDLSYVHMRVGRTPSGKALDPRFVVLRGARGAAERVRVPRGTRFGVGDPLGTVNSMAHVHLDYYPGGPNANPLALPFVGLSDSIAPRVQSIALYERSSAHRLSAKQAGRVLIPRSVGTVDIVADAWDQIDGNLARRRLGLYKIGYQLLDANGTPQAGFAEPLITQVYDRLPREREAVKLLYAANSGIPAYGSKATHFAYAVNNTLHGGQARAGAWNVAALAPGDYILRIYAADYAGLVATEGRDLPVRVE